MVEQRCIEDNTRQLENDNEDADRLSEGGDAEEAQSDDEHEAEIAPTNTVVVGRPVPPDLFELSSARFTQEELEEFALKPVQTGKKMQCQIQRRRIGVDKFHPVYTLYIEHPNGETRMHVLTARKRKKTQTSYYTISGRVSVGRSRTGREREKEVVLGKTRSNFLGTGFTIYSQGRSPFKEAFGSSANVPIREELAAVAYEPNILGFKGPRKMTVLLHTHDRSGVRPEFRPKTESQTLLGRFRNGETSEILTLHNKNPQWNEETQSFVLNFNGRVTQASVKNFQIVHDEDLDYIILQFGRVADDTFTLDFQYPMCPLQAFGIAMTSFDAKLACE